MNSRISTSELSILHVVLSLDGGGLERVVIDLVREGVMLGCKVSVLCVEKPGVLASKAVNAGANLYCAEKGPGLRWSAVKTIESILRKARPDVVHSHQISALLYLITMKRELMPLLVHTEHNNQFLRYRTAGERFRYLLKLALAGRRADRVFGVSKDATGSIARSCVIRRSKLFTVPNGIDFSRFQRQHPDESLRARLGIPKKSLIVGNVGRLTEMKRPDILLDAFAATSREFPDTHLLMVGDGPLMADLRAQAGCLRVSDRVHFTGFQADPEPYMRLLDIFVLTSRMEGMPLAVLEAAASGIPVIASRVGGLEEMSNDGRTFLLYDFENPEALNVALRRLIREIDFRDKLAEAGCRHVRSKYSSKRMGLDYISHYNQLFNEIQR